MRGMLVMIAARRRAGEEEGGEGHEIRPLLILSPRNLVLH